MKVNWKEKLSSRKFWAAVVGFVTPLVIASGGSDELITKITAIIMSGASLIAYIIGESAIDKEREKK